MFRFFFPPIAKSFVLTILLLTSLTTLAIPSNHDNLPKSLVGVNSIIVKFRDRQAAMLNTKKAMQDFIFAQTGFHFDKMRTMSSGAKVFTFSSDDSASLQANGFKNTNDKLDHIIEKLRKHPNVEFAEKNIIAHTALTPNDSSYGLQWYLHSIYAQDAAANLPLAWDITTGSPNTVVAIVDSGISKDSNGNVHSNLTGKVLTGYDFVDGDYDPKDVGPSYHGTHLAGIIAANTNNYHVVAGIDWQAKILPIRAFHDNTASWSDIIDGIRWAANLDGGNSNPAKVINLSFASEYHCTTSIQNTIDEVLAKGISIVVSAGNDKSDASLYTPGNCSGVITVAGTDVNRSKLSTSNDGTTVDIAAPGENIYSATTANPESYEYKSGTSISTAVVSGVVSLMYAVNPSITPSEIISILKNTGRPLNGGSYSFKIIDAAAAVNAAQSAAASVTTTLK